MSWAEAICTIGVAWAVAFWMTWDGRLPGARRERPTRPATGADEGRDG